MILTKRIYLDSICGKAQALKFINEKSDPFSAQIASEIIDIVELIRRKDEEEWQKQTQKIAERNEIWL